MRRGRAVGPRPGRVDVRGKVGASRAIQAALGASVDRSPDALAGVLAAVLADGDPWRDWLPLFDVQPVPASASARGPIPLPPPAVPPARPVVVDCWPLFDL